MPHASAATPASTRTNSAADEPRALRAALMDKVCGEGDMFALGSTIARVVQLTQSDNMGAHEMASCVLADAGLTQRILRLANTATFRIAGGGAVTTMSRAIAVLGLERVKIAALAMLLVDVLGATAHAQAVFGELEAALCASMLGREIGRRSCRSGVEETAIAALFKNLGALLVASHAHVQYQEIAARSAAGPCTVQQAALQVFGLSYEGLGTTVLGEWGIPESIVRVLASPPPGALRHAAQRIDWMRQAAAFSADAAALLVHDANPGELSRQNVLARYGTALQIDETTLTELLTNVQSELDDVMNSMHLRRRRPTVTAPPSTDLPGELLQATMGEGAVPTDARHPSGKPLAAPSMLLAGLQRITEMAARGEHLDQVLAAGLEVLHDGLGCRFSALCVQDEDSAAYHALVARGHQRTARARAFGFPATRAQDLFWLSLENKADLVIADAGQPKIQSLLPAWHRQAFADTRSFVVLPLVDGEHALGWFYGDRTECAPEGVQPDEAALIRAIKSRLVTLLVGADQSAA